MKERPIIFSGPMVRALLDGSKTQTRRVVKGIALDWLQPGMFTPEYVAQPDSLLSPYGYAGDRLYVRETWSPDFAAHYPFDRAWYAADDDRRNEIEVRDGVRGIYSPESCVHVPFRWRPSIHMPRWASRITLEVTGVRIERLQDISEADAIAEGVEPPSSERDEHDWSICPQCGGTGLYEAIGPNLGAMPDTDCTKCDTHAKRYRYLWESINGAESWEVNPWVWVVEFRIAPTQQGERDA